MAIPTSIADLTWLGPGEPAGAPFARGASAGATIANAWNQRRHLGMQEREHAEQLRIRQAEEARKAQEAAIQFAGFADYQAAVEAGAPPDEAIKKFGAAMFYKSPTFPNFLSAQERAQIASERAAETALHHTNLLQQRDEIETRLGSQFDRNLAATNTRSEEQRKLDREKLDAAVKGREEAEEGRNTRAAEAREAQKERDRLKAEHQIRDRFGDMGFQAFMGRKAAIVNDYALTLPQKEAAIDALYAEAQAGKYRPKASTAAGPAAAPVRPTAGQFETEAAARAAGHKAGDIVILVIEGKPTRVRLK